MPNLINFMSFIISASLCPPPSLPVCCTVDQPRDRGTARQLPADSVRQKVQVRTLLILLLPSPYSLVNYSRQQTKLSGKCQIRQKIRKAQNKLGSKPAMGRRLTVSSANAKVTGNLQTETHACLCLLEIVLDTKVYRQYICVIYEYISQDKKTRTCQ